MFRSTLVTRRLLSISVTVVVLSAFSLISPPKAHGFFGLFRQQDRRGRPTGRPNGGAVRDECPINDADADVAKFKALVPEVNKVQTHATHPTFWFHVPFARSEELRYAELMLLYGEDRTYALDEPILFHLPADAGIVKVQLPTSVPGLEPDRPYRWYFSIQCDRNELSRNPVLSGEIERSPQASTESLWPEAIMQELANGPSAEWQQFLAELGLEPSTQAIPELRPAHLQGQSIR